MCTEELHKKQGYYLPLALWFGVLVMYSQPGKYIHEAAVHLIIIFVTVHSYCVILCNGELSLPWTYHEPSTCIRVRYIPYSTPENQTVIVDVYQKLCTTIVQKLTLIVDKPRYELFHYILPRTMLPDCKWEEVSARPLLTTGEVVGRTKSSRCY